MLTTRELRMIPISRLRNGVAVEPSHVRDLAASIGSIGQLAPVMVRASDGLIIDGFHRVAALQQAGVAEAECLLIDCDDATFWDLRIISAVLHREVTFARAIDWIKESFAISPWTGKYSSAYSLFRGVRRGTADPAAVAWVKEKCARWGLNATTIEHWLHAESALAPDLLQEARAADVKTNGLSTSHYVEIGQALPQRPELQRAAARKAREERLSQRATRELADSLRRAETDEERQIILERPFTRFNASVGGARRSEEQTPPDTPQLARRYEAEREVRETATLARLRVSLDELASLIDQVGMDTLDRLTAPRLDEYVRLVDVALGKLLSLRERLEQLRQNPRLRAVQ